MNKPTINSIHHVCVVAEDMEASCAFYRDVLNLTELPSFKGEFAGKVRFFDLGEGRMLHISHTGEREPNTKAHFALDVADVAAWRRFIRSKRVPIIEAEKKIPGTDRFFVKDPAGNRVAFFNWSGYLKSTEGSTWRQESELARLRHKPYETASALLAEYVSLSQSMQN